jgi:hypothetical protein
MPLATNRSPQAGRAAALATRDALRDAVRRHTASR